MTFEGFITNSKAIIERFPNQQVWLQGGFSANRQLYKPEAGYCIVIRYDEKTTSLISHFIQELYSILPPVVEYNERSFHTTIGVFNKSELKGFVPDPSVLKLLSKSVQAGLWKGTENPEVTFEKWAFNNEAILVPGYPNHDLWCLAQNIMNACHENRVPLEPWRIIHITTARFIHGVSQQVFKQFLLLMESAPALEPTKPIAIDVATWRCDGLTFEMATHERYPLCHSETPEVWENET
jgi:hypothetical protein